MRIDNLILILCFLVIIGVMFFHYSKTKKTVKNAIIGMGSGFSSLGILYFIGSIFNISININIFSLLISIILGIPGVALMVILNLIFNINI